MMIIFFINVYVPNSQRELARLDYRMEFEDDFRKYITGLDSIKPVILCGDLNVAHQEIDLKKILRVIHGMLVLLLKSVINFLYS